MSVLLKGKKSWRFVSQLKQNIPSLFRRRSSVPLLGLHKIRAPPFAFHGSLLLSPCTAAGFSTAVEAVSTASPSVHSEDLDTHRDDESESAPAQAMVSTPEQEEVVLRKLIDENRQLFTVLQAELENQRNSANSILEEIRALKAQQGAGVVASKTSTNSKQPWLEWNVFLEYLQRSGFFKGEVKSPDADTVLGDPACVKRAVNKFSQVQDAIYELLSPMDIRILATYGSVANDQKAAAAQARLHQFFKAENEISNSTAAKVLPRPKLTDVTRLILSTVYDSQEDALLSDAKSSISHLLRELMSFNSKPKTTNVAPIRASDILESSTQEKEKPLRIEKKQDLSKVNSDTIEDVVKSAAKGEIREEVSTKLQQWKCPRCSFMNLDSKHRCVECSRTRPQRTYAAGTEMNTGEVSLGDDLLEACDDEKPKKAHGNPQKGRPSTAQVHKGLMDRSLLEEDEDTDMEASDMESDLSSLESKGGGDSENDLDILDDILKSEDSEDEPRGKGKMSNLLDDGKKTRLSELVPKTLNAPMKKGGDFGRKAGRWQSTKGKRFDDEEDDGTNEEGDGRFEARGGKFGRGRGDSFNARRNGGGGRGYGDRDRGYGDRDRGYGDRDGGYGDRNRGSGDRDRGIRGARGRSRY